MKLVLLDRDGVINTDSNAYVKSPNEWHVIPGAAEAIATLNAANFRVALCTNQSGVGRRLFTEASLHAIHNKMIGVLANANARLDAIYYCMHAPNAKCVCRKPAPGMLNLAMARFGASPAETCFVGDTDTDLNAARHAGCLGIQVLTGQHRTRSRLAEQLQAPTFDHLQHVVDWLMEPVGGPSASP